MFLSRLFSKKYLTEVHCLSPMLGKVKIRKEYKKMYMLHTFEKLFWGYQDCVADEPTVDCS